MRARLREIAGSSSTSSTRAGALLSVLASGVVALAISGRLLHPPAAIVHLAEALRRLAVYLAHAALRDAEDDPDLAQAEILPVVERQHLLHPLGQRPDVAREAIDQLTPRRQLLGIVGVLVRHPVEQV